jgi:hypothetical protein
MVHVYCNNYPRESRGFRGGTALACMPIGGLFFRTVISGRKIRITFTLRDGSQVYWPYFVRYGFEQFQHTKLLPIFHFGVISNASPMIFFCKRPPILLVYCDCESNDVTVAHGVFGRS